MADDSNEDIVAGSDDEEQAMTAAEVLAKIEEVLKISLILKLLSSD